jgi:glyoxylase-like metal-dependent hydrolase (beta-lactamase superfamily II)
MFTHHHGNPSHHTRRDFFNRSLGALAGVPIMELAFHRAAWGRALAQNTGDAKLFDISKAADGVYFALARVRALINSSAAIFVNERDVLVMDSQTAPSASAVLINQIRKEITDKPVRYVVNSHFHDDHSQGNSAFKKSGNKVDFIAHTATKELMAKEVPVRLKNTLEKSIPADLEKVNRYLEKATSAAEREYWKELLRQYAAFSAEMKHFELELPTLTFDKTHLIKDRAHELHIQFHGRAHTAGDVIVYCPQTKIIATGDLVNGSIPYMPDAFPKSWVKTLDSVNRLQYDQVLSGHGPIMHRDRVTNFRNFIEEMNGRVEEGKKAGKTLDELKQSITIASLKSLQDHNYAAYMAKIRDSVFPHWDRKFIGPKEAFQDGVNGMTSLVYKRIDMV